MYVKVWPLLIALGFFMVATGMLSYLYAQERPKYNIEVQKIETGFSTDVRALELPPGGGQCTKKPNRKPTFPMPPMDLIRHIFIESKKAIYCYIGRVGSSRWTRLALKPEGFNYRTRQGWFPQINK